MPTALLAFAGSARRDSLNRKTLRIAARGARAAGAAVTEIDLADFPLPLYDGDLEAAAGIPEAAARLRELIAAHDGLLIAAPEYNGMPTPLLKNTLDWVSRPFGDPASPRSGLAAFRGKAAGVVAASPGGLGGIRALPVVRQYLANLGLVLVAEQATVARADRAFDSAGELVDEAVRLQVERVGAAVARLAAALRTPA